MILRTSCINLQKLKPQSPCFSSDLVAHVPIAPGIKTPIHRFGHSRHSLLHATPSAGFSRNFDRSVSSSRGNKPHCNCITVSQLSPSTLDPILNHMGCSMACLKAPLSSKTPSPSNHALLIWQPSASATSGLSSHTQGSCKTSTR